MYEEWNRLIHSDQNGTVAGTDAPNSSVHYSEAHPAESRQLRVTRDVSSLGIGELLHCFTRFERDAKMPACRTEGGGGVVAKRHAVMAWTG